MVIFKPAFRSTDLQSNAVQNLVLPYLYDENKSSWINSLTCGIDIRENGLGMGCFANIWDLKYCQFLNSE